MSLRFNVHINQIGFNVEVSQRDNKPPKLVLRRTLQAHC